MHGAARAADRFRAQGRFEEAITLCLQQLRACATYVSARVVLARAYMESGETDRAEAEFHRVLELSPENLRARMHLGQICEAQGRRREAMGHYEAALEIVPLNREVRASLTKLQALISPPEPSVPTVKGIDALELAESGARPGPVVPGENPFATETLGDLYASQGLTNRAASIYRRLLDDKPLNETIRKKLAALDEIARGEQMLIKELERWLQGVRRYRERAAVRG